MIYGDYDDDDDTFSTQLVVQVLLPTLAPLLLCLELLMLVICYKQQPAMGLLGP